MIALNTSSLDLTINNPYILLDLHKHLMKSTKDCKDISITTPRDGFSCGRIHIRVDSSRPSIALAACGIKLCEVYGAMLMLIEEGLTGKYHVYPIDQYHIPASVKLTKLSLLEKAKVYVQVLKQYRVKVKFSLESVGGLQFMKGVAGRYGTSSLQTETFQAPYPAFFHVNVDELDQLQAQRKRDTETMNYANGYPTPVKTEEGVSGRPFWNEKTQPDPDLETNRVFDNQGVAIKAHDPRQARTYVGGFESKVDPIRGDDFSNRSFDKDFEGDKLTFENQDPFGHEQYYQQASTGESASFDLQTNAGLEANAQGGEAVKVELETDAAHDETYALSADHISEARIDEENGCLRVIFNGQPLFLLSDDPRLLNNITAISLKLDAEIDKSFGEYLANGGVKNFVNALARSHRCIIADLTSVAINQDQLVIAVDATSKQRHDQIATLFNSIRDKAHLPHDAQGNVADVQLEESKALPKKTEHSEDTKAIRIVDDKVFVVIGNKEFEETLIKSSDEVYFISTKLVKDWDAQTLELVALSLKANYGGKAKGTIYLARDDGGLAIKIGKKPRFQKLRHALDQVIESQDKDKGVGKPA